MLFASYVYKHKTEYTFLIVIPTFLVRPSALLLTPLLKECLARSEERTLTTLTQEIFIYLSADKLKDAD